MIFAATCGQGHDRIMLFALALFVSRGLSLSQQYCSSQNTGSDYDGGKCQPHLTPCDRRQMLRNLLTISFQQRSASTNPTELAFSNVLMTMLLPSSRARHAGVRITFPPVKNPSVNARITVQDFQATNAVEMIYLGILH